VEVDFYFPSFQMWKEEGKEVNFSLNFFFHCGVVEEGKGYFFNICIVICDLQLFGE
jgi:hypothetical protein